MHVLVMHEHLCGGFSTPCLYIRNGFFPILSPGEAVSKLGVGKLVQPTSRCHTEIAPHVLIAAKIQLLYRS